MATANDSAQGKPYEELVYRLWGYVLQGILLVLSNSVILISILYQDILRSKKEYALPALLAFRDAADGLAAILGGIGRNWFILTGNAGKCVSRRYCLFTPWVFIWIFAESTTESIFLMITIDRLIAVGWPLFHYGLTKTYSNLMIFIAISPAFISYTSAFTFTLGDNNSSDVSPICISYFVYSDNYYKVMYITKAVVALLSVILYIPVIVMYRQHNSDVSGVIHKEYIKSQRKFTVTLGISCLFNAIFYVVPSMVRAVLPYYGSLNDTYGLIVGTTAYMMGNINKIADIFLYSLRHRNLRLGVKFLFMRKQLTLPAIQNAVNAIVPFNQPAPVQKENGTRNENHHRITLAVPPANLPANRCLTPIGIRRPVIKQRVARL